MTTIPFEVRNRFTGEVQFTAQIACSLDELPSVKLGLAVKWAYANGASLDGASFVGARLVGARLDGASFVGARLDGARLDGASLDGASFVGARLNDETLRPFKADLWLTLSEAAAPHVIQLIEWLKAGEVDGSTYGDGRSCACLVGSLERAGATMTSRNSSRPAEQWFLMIRKGDLPGTETGGGFAAGKALQWTLDWCAAHGVPTEPLNQKGSG
jgi:hypothetical protein